MHRAKGDINMQLSSETTWLFLQIGVPFVGVLIRKALLFEVHSGAPDFWKLPYPLIKEYT